MNYGHHEYLFDYRHKDLETGKLNIDKLTTINSCQSYSDLVESGTECAVEYYERQRIIRKQARENYAFEQELRQKEEEIKHEKVRKELDSRLRELREYREQLEAREAELARKRRAGESVQYILYGDKRIRTG